ncbi:MAG: DUF5615 family PIN-like protein [Chloroflexi bacterium]|nr:DUF5615 family PIN-like protein [Chloroflexota bacterium]
MTAAEAGLLGTLDAQILDSSRAAGRVLVTHDTDFLRLHNEQGAALQSVSGDHARVRAL